MAKLFATCSRPNLPISRESSCDANEGTATWRLKLFSDSFDTFVSPVFKTSSTGENGYRRIFHLGVSALSDPEYQAFEVVARQSVIGRALDWNPRLNEAMPHRVDTLDGRLGGRGRCEQSMRKSTNLFSNASYTGKMHSKRSLRSNTPQIALPPSQYLRFLLNTSCQPQTLTLTGVMVHSTAISSNGVVSDTNDTHGSIATSSSTVEASMASSTHCPSSSTRPESVASSFCPPGPSNTSFLDITHSDIPTRLRHTLRRTQPRAAW